MHNLKLISLVVTLNHPPLRQVELSISNRMAQFRVVISLSVTVLTMVELYMQNRTPLYLLAISTIAQAVNMVELYMPRLTHPFPYLEVLSNLVSHPRLVVSSILFQTTLSLTPLSLSVPLTLQLQFTLTHLQALNILTSQTVNQTPA